MSLALQMVFNMQMLPTYLAIQKGMERRMSFQSKSHELRIIRYEEFSIHAANIHFIQKLQDFAYKS